MPDHVFAIDFTHEGLTASFVSLDGVDKETAGFDLDDFLADADGALDKLVAMLHAKIRASGHRVAAVAVSLPCDLDADREHVVNFPQAPWLNGQALPVILEEAFEAPVVMERRAVISLCYDRLKLPLPRNCLALGCYVDTHYDCAIWGGGQAVLGRNGRSGNISHLTIQEREDACFCGKAGCVDLYGAGTRLKQLHSMIFPDIPIEELFERHGDHPIVKDYLTMMAYPMAMAVNLLDPDFLVIGGAVPSMWGFPRAFLEGEIRRQCYLPLEGEGVTFLSSVASTTPSVVCAAKYALDRLGLE